MSTSSTLREHFDDHFYRHSFVGLPQDCSLLFSHTSKDSLEVLWRLTGNLHLRRPSQPGECNAPTRSTFSFIFFLSSLLDFMTLARFGSVQFNPSADASPRGVVPGLEMNIMKSASMCNSKSLFSLSNSHCNITRHAKTGEPSSLEHVLFAPVDTPSAVERFLTYWKPQAAIFMESELWPNLILKSSEKGILLALINARISPKSLWRWSLSPAKNLAAEIITSFSLIIPVNNKEALRYQELGAHPLQIRFAGNLKYASGAMDVDLVDGPTYHELERQLLGRCVWLAASTHPGEEEVVASTHKKLKGMFPNLLTIIVPRHPDRGQNIRTAIRNKFMLDVRQRSLNEPLDMNTDIYIADTLGELIMFYRLASLSFVGGSLFEGLNGHNIAEPASAGSAVITGCHVGHFQEMVAEMQRHSSLSIKQVSGEDELYESVRRLLNDGRILNLRRLAASMAANAAAADVVDRVYRWLDCTILRPAFGTTVAA